MKRVLKLTVPVDNQPHDIGIGPILRAECQFGPDAVQVWTEEAVGAMGRAIGTRRAQVVATGQEYPAEWHAMATTPTLYGVVWHVAVLPQEVTP